MGTVTTIPATATEFAAERFPRDTAGHQMTVLRDDGLYRHLRFRRVALNPATGKADLSSAYWFDLITWPGCLTVNGDCGTFTFARTADMFEFFRGHQINPGYWAEKVRGGARLKRYSEERFRERVMDVVRECEADYPGLAAAVEREMFGPQAQWSAEHEDGAREALSDFGYGDTYSGSCPSCDAAVKGLSAGDAYSWASQHRVQAGHSVYPHPDEGFRFTDTWEWDLGDWDWQFLWCCHAIQWGISVYDRNATSAVETVPVAGSAL
jgi:hypothetical protein